MNSQVHQFGSSGNILTYVRGYPFRVLNGMQTILNEVWGDFLRLLLTDDALVPGNLTMTASFDIL